MPTLLSSPRTPRRARASGSLASAALAFAALLSVLLASTLHAQRVTLPMRVPAIASDPAAVDLGALPASTQMHLTLTLTTTAVTEAALDQFLLDVAAPGSPEYHRWLTPRQFAARFGPTESQVATVSAWLTAQGLAIDTLSPAGTRLSVSGPAFAVEAAFAPRTHQYRLGTALHDANTAAPSLPAEMAPQIAFLGGLTDSAPSLGIAPKIAFVGASDPFSALAAAVDANTTALFTLTGTLCAADLDPGTLPAYRALLRQANAQGITLLAATACPTGQTESFPANLAEVTAVAPAAATPDALTSGIVTRPSWQSAPGLPEGLTRLGPDLTADPAALARTLSSILQQSGTRQGNIGAVFYSLATTPGLYSQPDSAPAGTWEPATGLGQVDLAKLAQVFPRGSTGSQASVSSSVYGATYGQPFTLSSTVQSTSGGGSAPVPTGTVTFSAASQGALGTASLLNGTAALPLAGTLSVGTYTISATYSGDAIYAASASPPSAVVTVSQAAGTITGSITPSTIGGSATAVLTVTVTLPYAGSAPAGTVTATVNGVAGAVYTATLTPIPNTPSASTLITIPAPIYPGNYTVQITCAGSANFQCPTPGLVPLIGTGSTGGGTSAGNTSTTLTASTTSPSAGQTVTLTATIASSLSGNPTGTVTFYDNGTSIASAPVSGRQAVAAVTLAASPNQSITATYSGDATFNSSSSAAVVLNVASVPSGITLTSSAASALRGANLLFTAQIVAGAPATGIVTFFDTYNGTTATLGTAALAATGTTSASASLTTSGLFAGTHQVYAVYTGDANTSAATSSAVSVAITDYTVTPTPQTLTIPRGQTGTLTLAIAAVGGFTGKVSASCLAPAGSQTTCAVSPASVTAPGTIALSIGTTAQARLAPIPFRATGASALAMLLVECLPRRRRRLPLFLLLLVGGAAITGTIGCGSTPAAMAPSGSPVGSIVFTIDTAGTDGVTTVTHDLQYAVTLQ